LASGAGRPDLSRHASVLAEDRSALHPACRQRHLEPTGRSTGGLKTKAAVKKGQESQYGKSGHPQLYAREIMGVLTFRADFSMNQFHSWLL
jgi:hypothetical protein